MPGGNSVEGWEEHPRVCPGQGMHMAAALEAGLVQSVHRLCSQSGTILDIHCFFCSCPSGKGQAQGLKKVQNQALEPGAHLAEPPTSIVTECQA